MYEATHEVLIYYVEKIVTQLYKLHYESLAICHTFTTSHLCYIATVSFAYLLI